MSSEQSKGMFSCPPNPLKGEHPPLGGLGETGHLELNYDVVLASKSPRRQQLLRDLGINFRVEVIEGIQEDYPASMPAGEVAQFLAIQKANNYFRFSSVPPSPPEGGCTDSSPLRELGGLGLEGASKAPLLLITADTIVVLDGEVLGKPADAAEAHQMLRNLSGKVHHVITGVCVTTFERQESFADVTEVEFAELTDDEINYYIEHYRPMDKAGAYGIQEWIGYMGVKRINGCFYNVMGLPVPRLYALLKSFDH